MGVVGTMVALEVKMRRVNERSKCPYCSGSGQLTCARCYGQQTVSYRTADGQVPALFPLHAVGRPARKRGFLATDG